MEKEKCASWGCDSCDSLLCCCTNGHYLCESCMVDVFRVAIANCESPYVAALCPLCRNDQMTSIYYAISLAQEKLQMMQQMSEEYSDDYAFDFFVPIRRGPVQQGDE